MKTVLFATDLFRVWDDGSYSGWERPRITADAAIPDNDHMRNKAKRAVELGLVVPIPEPVYKPQYGYAVGGTEEEIREILSRALDSVRWREAALGKIVERWDSDHGAGCYCGNCPADPVYGEEEKREECFAPAEGIIPEAWYAAGGKDRSRVRVQTSDYRRLFRLTVSGYSCCGGGLEPFRAAKYGAPPEVLAKLAAVNEEAARRRERLWEEQKEKEKAELKKLFGV